MKKLYFFVLALCSFNITAQTVNILDINFKNKLIKAGPVNSIAKNSSGNFIKVDSNNDGIIQNSEAELIVELYLDNYNSASSDKISNLEGIQFFTNLKILSCGDNLIESLDLSNVINLESLNLYKNKLKFLNIKDLASLKTLYCHSNQLTDLDMTSFLNLTELNCSDNSISQLNLKNCKKLTSLYCESNSIEKLDLSGLNNLATLYCSDASLKVLILEGLDKLKTLNVSLSPITNIDLSSLSSVEEIVMFGCKLTTLNVKELNNLQRLIISTNTELKELNLVGLINLRELECDSDNLETLNVSGFSNLVNVNCRHNKLKTINLTGTTNLVNFYGMDNLLTTINFNDSVNLKWAECDKNDLSTVFIKNGKTENIILSNNPNLRFICADEADLSYLNKNRKDFGLGNCEINTYCSFEPGGKFYNFTGKSKFDGNNNGCDVSDDIYKNLQLKITNGAIVGTMIANATGNFNIPLQEGVYTINPVLENPNYFTISPQSLNFTFQGDSNIQTQDFCISYNGLHPDLEVILYPLNAARPGFEAKYKIIFKNKGTAFQSGAINLNFSDTILDYISSDTPIALQENSNLKWNFSNLKPFEVRGFTFVLKINKPTDTPAVDNGDLLKYKVSIASESIDETPNDNTFTLNQTVVGSYDPNDKTCLEGSIVTPSLIGEYVHYMIRFENTGTYSAQNIVVKDMIDLSKFDISTLIPTSSSHSFVTKISEGNKVEFIFENINLPFDDANNDGYIAFKIKTKPTLKVGDSFTNDANIYFDYNFPILTNKATSTFKNVLSTEDFNFSKYLNLYPNPANQVLNISQNQNIEIQSFEIYDILGQLVIAIPSAKTTSNIDVSKLRTGNYFIKVKSDKGSSSMKFIKN